MRKLLYWGSMAATKNALIAGLRRYFLPRKEVLAVYLFGSRASGSVRSWSDADVAVLLAGNRSGSAFSRKLRFAADLAGLLGTETDVVVLNDADPFLRIQVLTGGQEVLARDRARLDDFRRRSLRDYWDFVPVMRMLDAGALRRLRGYRWTGS